MAVFIDGDFWHGFRFEAWRDKLSEKWEAKIEANRKRDERNFRRLRREGWKVLRLWEHQVQRDIALRAADPGGAGEGQRPRRPGGYRSKPSLMPFRTLTKDLSWCSTLKPKAETMSPGEAYWRKG